jgi:hypothetical protein
MSNLYKDFLVVTVRRDDIAHAIFINRDNMEDEDAEHRAEMIDDDVMQMIADRMASMYFDTDMYDFTTNYNKWITDAWEELNLDEELEFPPDTTGSA